MKWSIFIGFLVVCLARYNEGGALRCIPGEEDPSCIVEREEKVTTVLLTADDQEGAVQAECLAGSEWKSNCHKCKCTDSGTAKCFKEEKCQNDTAATPIRCKPNTMYKRECNRCLCLENGSSLCTLVICTNKPKNFDLGGAQESEERRVVQRKRQPGENFQNSHKALKRSVCKPNQEFQSECNSCKCSADGLRYTCTQNECLDKDMDKEVEVFMENEGVDHIERHSVCKPRDTFYIACNTCHCNPLGTDYTCTNKPCPLPADVELFHELKEMKPIVPVISKIDHNSKLSKL